MNALSEKDLQVLRNMVPSGPSAVSQWKLDSTEPGVQVAADALSALVVVACETVLDTLRVEGRYAAQQKVLNLYDSFATEYRDFGAKAPEPMYQFQAVVTRILLHLRQFKLDW